MRTTVLVNLASTASAGYSLVVLRAITPHDRADLEGIHLGTTYRAALNAFHALNSARLRAGKPTLTIANPEV